MEDRKPTIWAGIWMIVALIGLVGMLLGYEHQFITLLFGIVMVYITGESDNSKTNLR